MNVDTSRTAVAENSAAGQGNSDGPRSSSGEGGSSLDSELLKRSSNSQGEEDGGDKNVEFRGHHPSKNNSTVNSRRVSNDAVELRTNSVSSSVDMKGQTISYSAEKVIGNGSFGVVFRATVVQTGEVVAIKKVLQDKRFKNRELQIMRKLNHPNIVQLKHCFYSNGDEEDELYLNLVLEFVPETVYKIARSYKKAKQAVPKLLVQLYIYQLSRALAYIHAMGICHRDIKPQNLLVDPVKQILKLCDFGSAKRMVPSEPNVSYICSRYYRAPELIFGSTDYTTAIDIWSMGCVFGELLLGQPLFPGQNGVDQLVEIIKSLGTPTREEIEAMNKSYTEFKFPQIKPHPWQKMFPASTDPRALDLISKMLVYEPGKRIHPLEACAHEYFDDLRDPSTRLVDGSELPPELFELTNVEYASIQYVNPDLVHALKRRVS